MRAGFADHAAELRLGGCHPMPCLSDEVPLWLMVQENAGPSLRVLWLSTLHVSSGLCLMWSDRFHITDKSGFATYGRGCWIQQQLQDRWQHWLRCHLSKSAALAPVHASSDGLAPPSLELLLVLLPQPPPLDQFTHRRIPLPAACWAARWAPTPTHRPCQHPPAESRTPSVTSIFFLDCLSSIGRRAPSAAAEGHPCISPAPLHDGKGPSHEEATPPRLERLPSSCFCNAENPPEPATLTQIQFHTSGCGTSDPPRTG